MLYFYHLREIIAYELELSNDEVFCGEIEVDKSYFGDVRRDKQGQGVKDKTPVFGLLKRSRVYTKGIADAKQQSLIPIIKGKVVSDSIVYNDSWKAYNALDISEFKHM